MLYHMTHLMAIMALIMFCDQVTKNYVMLSLAVSEIALKVEMVWFISIAFCPDFNISQPGSCTSSA